MVRMFQILGFVSLGGCLGIGGLGFALSCCVFYLDLCLPVGCFRCGF